MAQGQGFGFGLGKIKELQDAFQKAQQVQEFSKGVSQRMVSHERFFTISADVITNDSVEPDIFSKKFGHNFKDTVRPLASVFS